MPRTKQLDVYLDGAEVGIVEQSPQGALRFTYDDRYRTTPDATPLSLSMPVAGSSHGNKVTRAFLDGLLPDSEPVRQRWGRQYAVSPNNPFALLTHVGRDAAGAVQILPSDVDPPDAATRHGDVEWLTDDDFAAMSRELAEHGADWDPGREGGRWSLAGAQPKIALFRDPATDRWGIPRDSTPTTHIVKPALEGFEQHHLNEALCLRAARRAGLWTSTIDLVDIAGVSAVIVHRYDRQQVGGRWTRLHQEDLCQALAVHPSLKYQSDGGPGVADIGDLFALLALEDRTVSTERFFKALALNVLIGGTDAHAKNYSLLLIGPRAQFAPLYDVASAAPYPQRSRLLSAMKVGNHWKMGDVQSKDWQRVGRRLGINGDQAVAWVDDLRTALPDAFADAVTSLPATVRSECERMADQIVAHIHGTWRPE